MFYIALFFVFGLAFLVPVIGAVFAGAGSRGRWDSILVGLFTGAANVGLVTGFITVVLFFAPDVLVSGVGLLSVIGGVIAISVAMMRVTRGWLRDSDHHMDGVSAGLETVGGSDAPFNMTTDDIAASRPPT